MRLLLDTHALLWAASDPDRLSLSARRALLDLDNERLVSVVSCWEAVLKYQSGKLGLSREPALWLQDVVRLLRLTVLPLTYSHIDALARLPTIGSHKDPFDRLLVAQCQTEGLMLVTRDPAFRHYDIPVLW